MKTLVVEDPLNKERKECVLLPRFRSWRCGACGRGWVYAWIGGKCDKCGAVVVEVNDDDSE